jgi:hypothetical protein
MTQETPPKEDRITEEFRQLGENLVQIIRTAWESPERKRIQQDISNGLAELTSTLRNEAQKLNETEAAQRIRSGQVETRVREEVLTALRTVNTELERAAQRMQRPGTKPGGEAGGQETNPAGGTDVGWEPGESAGQASTQAPQGPSPAGHHEVHPDDDTSSSPNAGHQ